MSVFPGLFLQVRCYSEITLLRSVAFAAEQCSDWRGLQQRRHNDLFWMVGYLPLFSFTFLSLFPAPLPLFFPSKQKSCLLLGGLVGSTYFLLQGFFGFTWQGGRGGLLEKLCDCPLFLTSSFKQ